ncbi:MAG: FlgD immunoglobulin-like domain containing protein [bacterium]
MNRHVVFVGIALLLAAPAVARDIMVKSHEIPLEAGTYGRFRQNQSLFMWTPFDSMRAHWDLTGYQGGYTARIGLRPASEGISPAPDSMNTMPPAPTIVEKDTIGSGSVQDIYLHKTPFGLWINGIDFAQPPYRFIGNYRPNQNVYNTPMYRGAGWMTEHQWVYEVLPGIFLVFTQQNTKRIIARGKVRVPMSGDYYWPCLVIRDRYIFTDNAGSPDQYRWIYEWVVPGHFVGANGVAAAMSQNGASENFINVEQFFQLEQLSVPGWDLIPPTFEDAVELGDTGETGPFVVSTRILDNNGVGPESLFYRVDEGSWQAVGSDSSTGSSYFYTIPEVTAPARVDYFYWAMDEFCAAESIEFWTTWPVCSPESTMITFNVTQVGVKEMPGISSGLSVTVTPNPARGLARFAVEMPGATAGELRLYSLSGRLVRSMTLHADGRSRSEFNWDGADTRGHRLASGTYLWQMTAGSVTRNGKLIMDR